MVCLTIYLGSFWGIMYFIFQIVFCFLHSSFIVFSLPACVLLDLNLWVSFFLFFFFLLSCKWYCIFIFGFCKFIASIEMQLILGCWFYILGFWWTQLSILEISFFKIHSWSPGCKMAPGAVLPLRPQCSEASTGPQPPAPLAQPWHWPHGTLWAC